MLGLTARSWIAAGLKPFCPKAPSVTVNAHQLLVDDVLTGKKTATIGEKSMGWEGAYRIRDFLDDSVRRPEIRPRDCPGVYVLSQRRWREAPDEKCGLLYVGQSPYLRFRIGEFFTDLLGFTSDDFGDGEAYKHRGGHAVWHRHCLREHISPLTLWLGWFAKPLCLNCAEADLGQMIRLIEPCRAPGLKCERHTPLLDLAITCASETDSGKFGKLPRGESHSNGTREPPTA